MFKKSIVSLCALGLVVLMAAAFCHSEEFWLARKKLKNMELNAAQRAEIAVFEKNFEAKWRRDCRAPGHKHDHKATQFIAAASGVLTPEQFKKFRGRARYEVENVGYDIRLTGQHIDNLLKLVDAL